MPSLAGDKGEIKGIRTLTYTKSEEKSWTWSVSVTVGASVTVGLFGNDVGTSLTVTASGGETNTNSTTKTDTVSGELPVEPGRSDSFFVSGTKELVNIPWTATAAITYTDGTTGEMPTSGMYTGRSVCLHNNSFTASVDFLSYLFLFIDFRFRK